MAKALDNIRVLDLSRVLAGPWATQLLGDLGAEVIKVERIEGGDDTRSWGPPFQESAVSDEREASYFLSANRNKKSICVDISTVAGQTVIRELAAASDVVIENFKTGALARYGLDADSLLKINPQLVYCSITGFGQTGPYAALPGYDLLIQAMGGLMSVTGVPDGQPGAGPMKVGVALVDILTGLYAANAIQAALLSRQRTGKGQAIDVSLLDCLIAAMANQSQAYLATGVSPGRLGNAHPSICPYDVFTTADGYLVLAVGNDRQFRALCGEIGLGDYPDDNRFATNSARVEHREQLTRAINEALSTRTTSEWMSALANSKVPAGPVNTLADVFADPHVRARGTQVELTHQNLGTIPAVRCPIRLGATPVNSGSAPPSLGQDTAAVLHDVLGYCPEHILELEAGGAVSGAARNRSPRS
ncbi:MULTISPECIES: CaiB/BaiF CoA transferase family protein [Henriciella]|uniref:CaiB/BaiF CoA transferase family protein n=1 Tax=Henriciella TaxID=453849 RepID=UPI003515FE68